MVFQDYALYPHMNVARNMSFALRLQRRPKKEIDETVGNVAETLGLTDFLHRKPGELSGGQRQRVAMGRALTRDAGTFLFDEPLSNLDAKLRVQMRLEIRELQEKLGITSLYVTHDQVEAMTMADRMIVMNGGIAEQIGTPLDVYETPRTLFAAQFIGSPAMNIFDAECKDGTLKVGDVEIGPAAVSDGAVKLGIRPEHLVQDDNGPIEAAIQISEPLGANTLLHGQFTANKTAITISLPGVHPIEGKHVNMRFSVSPTHMHFFDPTKGHRLER
jgi:sn-glycerol 3-phosphate transport system ATP-binding protein